MKINSFNVRIYGLLIWQNQVLITHEHRAGMLMTKFPGGGLEKGEGIHDCLVREFDEELELEIEPGELFYVNDFLQVSAFNPKEQLIAIYYRVHAKDFQCHEILTHDKVNLLKPGEQIFEWKNIADLDSGLFTFPIDQLVTEKLKSNFR
ncbi:MAG: NUDIX domain-containing protein [Crocinitomicaceae bacterium]|nr:NUDIX domain-containing protein [Crocinitomicaceae bacterium]